ncbi:MAG TPA: acylphosphatase, partial [Xanthobacteraceae bacterium]|nr:acylphosphatase [Xanthobacteraceae bacterium]
MISIRHVVIRGRVQGVGFRMWVEHHASLHDLEGWRFLVTLDGYAS